MKRRVLLIGGRSQAKSLALSLLSRGYQVTAINMERDDCLYLSNIRGLNVMYGDGTKPFILEEAGAAFADMAIALTPHDEDNLVACKLCKAQFQVSRTVSLVSDPKMTDFFCKMGIDSVVCAIAAITHSIEQRAFMDEISQTIPLSKAGIQVSEVPVPANAPAVGKKLWEISLPRQVIIGCILRGNSTMIPHGDTRICAGDVLILICDSAQRSDAIYALTGEAALEFQNG